jgi:GNAT superfamily N-acetyltransferase
MEPSFGIDVRPLAASDLDRLCDAVKLRSRASHRWRLDAQERSELVYLIGWADLTIVGHVMVIDGSRVPDSEWRDRLGCAEVGDLLVLPPHRRRGFGRVLMTVAEDEARKRGHHRLGLATGTALDPGYAPARALYRSMEYRDVATGPWIVSWFLKDDDGRRRAGLEILGSYFVKSL